FPEIQSGLITIVQDRVRLPTVRHDDKGCFEQQTCLLFCVEYPRDQIFSYPMTMAVQQQPTPLHNTRFIPRRHFHECGGNTSDKAGQASQTSCQDHMTPLYNKALV